MYRTRVVAADDYSPVLTTVAAMLRDSFDVVGLVSDGGAALEATQKLGPDLVVLDISMPGMSGIDVAHQLRNWGCKAKIVFLTVHEDADILLACQAAGGLGYVIKGFIATDLVLAMNGALTGRSFTSRFPSQHDMV